MISVAWNSLTFAAAGRLLSLRPCARLTRMEPYLVWLILGFTLVIIEMTTGTFYLLVLGVSCFGAAGAAFFGLGFPVQGLIAALLSGVGANLAKQSNTLIIPTTASDVAGFIATAMSVLEKSRPVPGAENAPR